MPAITRVEAQTHDPDRVSLYDDETFLIGLDARVWAESPYAVGDTVDDEALMALSLADAQRRARSYAFAYLGYKARTAQQLRRRLQERGFDAEVAGATVEDLSAAGYVDDHAYAVAWLEERLRLRPRGHRGIRAELRQRGVARAVIDQVLDAHYPDEAGPALELARRRLQRRLEPGAQPDRFTILEIIGPYLRRRGFAGGTIHQTARELAHRWRDEGRDNL